MIVLGDAIEGFTVGEAIADLVLSLGLEIWSPDRRSTHARLLRRFWWFVRLLVCHGSGLCLAFWVAQLCSVSMPPNGIVLMPLFGLIVRRKSFA